MDMNELDHKAALFLYSFSCFLTLNHHKNVVNVVETHVIVIYSVVW